MGDFNMYWPVYKHLEKETLELAHYIHFDDRQLGVYSFYIADLLVRCAIEIEAISKEMYWQNGGEKRKEVFFDTDCLALLDELWGICEKRILVTATCFYLTEEKNRVLKPLHNAGRRGGAKWNKAYQAVKHDRKQSIKQGNIENLIQALGALYILNVYYSATEVELGITNTPQQDFDSSLGSDIFSVSVIDATVQVEIGTGGTDEAIANEIREQFKETIYILRYTNNSWSFINETLEDEQQELREALAHSIKFQEYVKTGKVKKESNLFQMVSEFLGADYMRKHGSLSRTDRALSHAQKEAVIYKKQPIYGVGR